MRILKTIVLGVALLQAFLATGQGTRGVCDLESVRGISGKVTFKADQYTTIVTNEGRRIAIVDLPQDGVAKGAWYGIKAEIPAARFPRAETAFFIRSKSQGISGSRKFAMVGRDRETHRNSTFGAGRRTDVRRWEEMSFKFDSTKVEGQVMVFIGIEGTKGHAEFDLDSLSGVEPTPAQPPNPPRALLAKTIGLGPGEDFSFSDANGRYWVFLEVRSGRCHPIDSLYGALDLLLPQNGYRLFVDGVDIPLKLSCRVPCLDGTAPDGSPIYKGYVFSKTSVRLTSSSRIRVACDRPEGVTFQARLLSEDQYKAERLLSGDLFATIRDNGSFGYAAWDFGTQTEGIDYPLASVEKFGDAARKAGLTGLSEAAKKLKDDCLRFFMTESVPQGALCVNAWEALRVRAFREIGTSRVSQSSRAEVVLREAAPSSRNGRLALLWADCALEYGKEFARLIRQGDTGGESRSFADLAHLISLIDHEKASVQKAEGHLVHGRRPVRLGLNKPVSASVASGAGVNVTKTLLLNGVWDYAPIAKGSSPDDYDRLPSEWLQHPVPCASLKNFYNPCGNSDEVPAKNWGLYNWGKKDYDSCFFKTTFVVPSAWQGSRFTVRIGEASFAAAVYVNGAYCGHHFGGLVPFEIDVTKAVRPGEENALVVQVDGEHEIFYGRKSVLFPVPSNVGPILRLSGDVEFVAEPKVTIRDVYVRTRVAGGKVSVSAVVTNMSASAVVGRLMHEAKGLRIVSGNVRLDPGAGCMVVCEGRMENPRCWGIGGKYGDPHNRYRLDSCFDFGERSSRVSTPFAFREVELLGRKIFLNGHELTIQGTSISCSDFAARKNRDNYFWMMYHNLAMRACDVNYVRHHRYNLHPWSIRACDDAGLISAGEAPWWALPAPPDINGDNDIRDPVWLKNSKAYYRSFLWQYRNSPSMLFYSLQNETMNRVNRDVFSEFRRVAEETVPHIVCYGQSIATCDSVEDPVAVIHDYGVGDRRVACYAKSSERPFWIGEYWNCSLFHRNSDPKLAAAAERQTAAYFRKSISAYRHAGADAVLPFGFEISGLLGTWTSVDRFGPWGDVLSQNPLPYYSTPVSWPAQSGSMGCQVREMLFLDSPNDFGRKERSYLNFWDENRPAMTFSATIADGIRAGFDNPIPALVVRRSPSLLVTIRRDGKAVPFAQAFVDDVGVRADKDGKAYFHLSVSGIHQVRCGSVKCKVDLSPSVVGKPGYAWLDRLTLDLATGGASFDKGVGEELSLRNDQAQKGLAEEKSAVRKDRVVITDYKPQLLSACDPMREYLVCGPFPNPGGRPDCKGFAVDFIGGEEKSSPKPGDAFQAEFPEDAIALWEKCSFAGRWRTVRVGKDGRLDLSRELVCEDVRGLDAAPLQYVVGYAFSRVVSESDCTRLLSVETYAGVKVYVNGKQVLADHRHTDSADDNSKVLAVAKAKRLTVPIHLMKGENRILVKCDADYGSMSVVVRLLLHKGVK